MIVGVVAVLMFLAIPVGGILAAIAIPNFITAMERSKQKRTMADMRMLAREIEIEHQERGKYPETFSPKTNDGWGRPYVYHCFDRRGEACVGYGLASAGKDGKFEKESPGDYTPAETDRFDCDIVYANGQFVQLPRGANP